MYFITQTGFVNLFANIFIFFKSSIFMIFLVSFLSFLL